MGLSQKVETPNNGQTQDAYKK